MEEKEKVISVEEIAKVKRSYLQGEIVDLPPFDNGTKFKAKLCRLSLLELCKSGVIPNALLAATQEIYEGKQRSSIKDYAEVIDIICTLCMVDPKYEDVKEIVSDVQRLAILTFAQSGVAGLISFRQVTELSQNNNSSKK